MKNKHLNELEIQGYIVQKTNCDPAVAEHVRLCINCQLKAAQYQLLFDGIKEQEKPAFEFNLAELVMEQLPVQQQKVSFKTPFFYFILFVSFLFIGAGCYLFGNSVFNLFFGITPIVAGLIITTVACLLIFLCIDMYKKYQIKMQALNFY